MKLRYLIALAALVGLSACQTTSPKAFAPAWSRQGGVPPRSPANFSNLDKIFDMIYQDAQRLGMHGYDLTACVDSRNNLVLGGVSFWNAPLQLISYIGGSANPVKMKTKDIHAKDFEFSLDGAPMLFRMARDGGDSAVVNMEGVSLGFKCFSRYSGLESLQPSK